MEEIKQQPDVVTKNTANRFQPGHPKYGGRKKRSPQMVRELADKLGVDPIQFLLKKVIAGETFTEVRIAADGKTKTRVEVPVTLDMKMEACRIVSGYLYPKLSTTQVTGKDEGPIAVAALDITAILQNPELAQAAQRLALGLAAQKA